MVYRGEQNIEPQLGIVWNRCERPCRTQRDDSSCGIYVLTVITLILTYSTLSVDVAHANNRYYGYYFYCYSLYACKRTTPGILFGIDENQITITFCVASLLGILLAGHTNFKNIEPTPFSKSGLVWRSAGKHKTQRQ